MPSNIDIELTRDTHRYCFCADGHYVNFIVPAVESIAKSIEPDRQFCVDIIVDQTPGETTLVQLEHLCPGGVTVHVIDASQFKDLLEVTHISRGMYYRLLIPELVQADRVLYLDCDVLVRKSLSPLFQTDMRHMLAAAVVNPFYDATRLSISKQERYFNSGVMLINCAEWRSQGIKGKVLDYLRGHTDLLTMPDQDALNVVLKGRWLELDPTYNCQVSMLLRYRELNSELGTRWTVDFLRDPAIMHFSSAHKQWHHSSRIIYSREYQELSTHLMSTRRGKALDFLIGRLRQLRIAFWHSNPFFY